VPSAPSPAASASPEIPASSGGFGGFTPPGAGSGSFGSGTGPIPAVPPTPSAPASGGNGTNGEVRVPAPPENGHDQRLPIFDSLESDWFRRSGTSAESGGAAAPTDGSWNSPADEGWRAAQVAAAPNAEENTTAGLPKRVPRANLVPGSVGSGEAAPETAAPPSRSADDIRSRMSSFQRGVRQARAAAPQTEEP
jgi:hypothetical protein